MCLKHESQKFRIVFFPSYPIFFHPQSNKHHKIAIPQRRTQGAKVEAESRGRKTERIDRVFRRGLDIWKHNRKWEGGKLDNQTHTHQKADNFRGLYRHLINLISLIPSVEASHKHAHTHPGNDSRVHYEYCNRRKHLGRLLHVNIE